MQALQHHPLAGDHILRPKSGRTPLKPVNSPATPVNAGPVSKAKPPAQECINISVFGPSNKENGQVYGAQMIETAAMDASLAEELSAMRKKLERIRLDRERTDKMLKEREAMLDLKMKEIENRGQIQKMVEIDVDRVFRLNQLHSQSIVSSNFFYGSFSIFQFLLMAGFGTEIFSDSVSKTKGAAEEGHWINTS